MRAGLRASRLKFALIWVLLFVPLGASGCLGDDSITRALFRGAAASPTPTVTRSPTPSPTVPTPTITPSPTPAPGPGRVWASVLRVWDGNTVLIEGGLSVRYIGVSTPGAGMFGRPLEVFGRQAAERNVALVEGQRVELEADAQHVDEAGLLLRYVYVGGEMVNAVLLREGLGQLAPLAENTRHALVLRLAEAEARRTVLNVWTMITATPTVTPTSEVPPTWTPRVPPTPGRTLTPTASPRVPPTTVPTRPLTPAR